MIVGSLVLILSAAGLLAVGLVIGSDWLLGASIVASVIAAVMLYIGARQSSATRAERRSADDWDAEQSVDEYDRREDYPTEPVPTGYPDPGRYDAASPPEEQRFTDRGGFDGDERYETPEPVAERYDAAEPRYDAIEQQYGAAEQQLNEDSYDVTEQPAQGADRFADLRHYEENAFSDPQTAAYDRGAGYPEPPVAERVWTPQSTERVPAQRDAHGSGDDESGYGSEPPPSDDLSAVTPGQAAESGTHAALEPATSTDVEHEASPARAEGAAITVEARRLERLPPDEWVGGGVDDEDPKDEPPIERRTAEVAAAVARMATDVFVIDGRPRYHVPGCVHLLGRESEPLPADEAVDLGFTPCSLCEPDTVLVSGAAEKARR